MDRVSSPARTQTGRRGAIALSLALLATLAMGGAASASHDPDLDAQGAALVDEFITILKQPEADKKAALEDFLAGEFQIVRSNGVRMDQSQYIENPATVFEVEISDLHATGSEDVIVVSYTLSVNEVLDGVETQTQAPRLSVFHEADDGSWQIAAHANFGALEPQ